MTDCSCRAVAALVLMLLSTGCVEETSRARPEGAGRPQSEVARRPGARAAVAAEVRVLTLSTTQRLIDIEGRAARLASPVRRRAQKCLPIWRSVPIERSNEALTFYSDALARASIPARSRELRSWVRKLRAVSRVDEEPDVLRAATLVEDWLRVQASRRRATVPLCDVLGQWRAASWQHAPALVRASRPSETERAGGERIERSLERAFDSLGISSAVPESVSLLNPGRLIDAQDRCEDRVFAALAPEDGFCG